ncbi:hypothetical protein [Neisseria dentiae]|uniref:hypothetical protein n=1 Tax=Neisseria dentiae TaxID=194197 RepID=UPI001302065F|nr:hypothetical protein [Neisseria dentiae]QMT44679.1 hypothetical protein H3L92_09520 [Neisseria dentiae]
MNWFFCKGLGLCFPISKTQHYLAADPACSFLGGPVGAADFGCDGLGSVSCAFPKGLNGKVQFALCAGARIAGQTGSIRKVSFTGISAETICQAGIIHAIWFQAV